MSTIIFYLYRVLALLLQQEVPGTSRRGPKAGLSLWDIMEKYKRKDIIFFDGSCGFCDRWTRWILEKDVRRNFLVAPLDGETFRRLSLGDAPSPGGVILRLRDGRVFHRSEAVRRILGRLGGRYRTLASLLGWFPLPVRDGGYAAVARFRHLLPRGPARCRISDAAIRARLLP